MVSRMFKFVLFIFSSFMLLSRIVSAGPVVYGSIARLVAQADTIVVASVHSNFSPGTVSSTINVEQVLKGAVIPGTSIMVDWANPGPQSFAIELNKSRAEAGHGVIFLQRKGDGTWAILPVAGSGRGSEGTYLHTPSSPPPDIRKVVAASVPPGASTFDKVFAEMTTALEAGAIMPFDLVDEFRETGSPVLTAAFNRFLQNPKLMALGLRGTILSGNPALLLAVRQNYTALASMVGWSQLLQEIKSRYLNTSPLAIQTLGQIAADPSVGVDLRIAVAGALSRMHTPQTLPYLAGLMMDRDVTLRSFAVGGMASFANNVPIGSHEPAAGAWPYRTDDTIAHSGFDGNDVNFWQNWWRQNQSRITQ